MLGLFCQTTALLAAQAGDRRLVLGVDDAHPLDPVSATLVHQLAVARTLPLVVTVRSGAPPPDPIVALWKDGHLVRIDLQPLSSGEVGELLAAVLDGPVDGLTSERFWTLSGGNPLYLHELVVSTVREGGLARRDAVWVWRGPLVPSPSLQELVQARVGTIDAESRTVLELLSLAEPLDADLLGRLASPAALVGAEHKQLVQIRAAPGGQEVRLAHPLYGEVVRAGLSVLDARQRRAVLAHALHDEPPEGPAGVLRLATLCLDAGVAIDPGVLVAAATHASAALDHPLAEWLARAAADAGGGFAASFALVDAVMYQGRDVETDAALEALQRAAATDEEREVAALHRAGLLFWGLGRVSEADAVLRDGARACTDESGRLALEASRAFVHLHAGRADDALAAVGPLLASDAALDRQLVWPAAAATLAHALTGRTGDVVATSSRGWDALGRAPGSGLDPYSPMTTHGRVVLGDAEGLGLRLGGSIAEAEASATRLHDRALAEARPLFTGAACILRGQAALARGQPVTARRWLRQAVPLLAGLDPVECRYHAHLALAEAWALRAGPPRRSGRSPGPAPRSGPAMPSTPPASC
jgi:hypothetical protein